MGAEAGFEPHTLRFMRPTCYLYTTLRYFGCAHQVHDAWAFAKVFGREWHSGDYGPFVFRTTTKANITLIIRYRYHNRRYWYQR